MKVFDHVMMSHTSGAMWTHFQGLFFPPNSTNILMTSGKQVQNSDAFNVKKQIYDVKLCADKMLPLSVCLPQTSAVGVCV